MWHTSPVQASLHKRLGNRWGPACFSAHQAPSRSAFETDISSMRRSMARGTSGLEVLKQALASTGQ